MSVIVCGVDGSPATVPVREAADWVGRALHARLIVVHAIERPSDDVKAAFSALLHAGMDRHVEMRLVSGPPVQSLIRSPRTRTRNCSSSVLAASVR
jgi:hypothetical protein